MVQDSYRFYVRGWTSADKIKNFICLPLALYSSNRQLGQGFNITRYVAKKGTKSHNMWEGAQTDHVTPGWANKARSLGWRGELGAEAWRRWWRKKEEESSRTGVSDGERGGCEDAPVTSLWNSSKQQQLARNTPIFLESLCGRKHGMVTVQPEDEGWFGAQRVQSTLGFSALAQGILPEQCQELWGPALLQRHLHGKRQGRLCRSRVWVWGGKPWPPLCSQNEEKQT